MFRNDEAMLKLSQQEKAQRLFKRYEGNPILTVEHWPYPTSAVFNPAAAKLNTETLLLARVEDLRGFSHLTVARSADGFTNWEIDPAPSIEADQNSREERWGLEDPRIVWLEEKKKFALTYVSFSEGGQSFHWRSRRISRHLLAWVLYYPRRIRMPAYFLAGSTDVSR
jgi:beta-1,4-mannooligosaccharide/beta-1,4-mannosyl-N-acetylglucosamine phosphorylase